MKNRSLCCTTMAVLLGAMTAGAELPGQAGDIAIGLSLSAATTTTRQVRAGTEAGRWTTFSSIQSIEYDNALGLPSNGRGNLLGLVFNNSGGAGALRCLSTDGSATGLNLLNINGDGITGPTQTTAGGLSVSPNNDHIAFMGVSSGRLVVMGYNAGANPGAGSTSGAAVSGFAETDPGTFSIATGITCGTAWLDNDTVIVFAVAGPAATFPNAPTLYTFDVTPGTPNPSLSAPTERVAVPFGGLTNSRFLSVAYQPSVSPYIYAMFSNNGPGMPATVNLLAVVNPADWSIVQQVSLGCDDGASNATCTLQTAREIALGADRYLYMTQYAGSQSPTNPRVLIDRLNLDVDGNGVINAADVLLPNSTVDYYSEAGNATNQGSFTGIAVSLTATPIADPVGACCRPQPQGGCVVVTAADCTGLGGTYNGNATTCEAAINCLPPTGSCCVATGCVNLTSADCAAQSGTYRGDGTLCSTSPCVAVGACCLPAGTCITGTAAACYNAGGYFQGGDTTCGAVACVAVAPVATTFDFDTNVVGTPARNTGYTVVPDLSLAAIPGTFTSRQDVFGVIDRFVNFDFADDSLSIFPADNFGILRDARTDRAFGVQDLLNPDNESGTGTASWTFDISGLSNVRIEIEAAALGNFEDTGIAGNSIADTYNFTASIDGGTPVAVFTSDILEGVFYAVQLEGGAVFSGGDNFRDPVAMNGIALSNDFVRLLSANLGSGATLTLTFDATSDGSPEPFIFDTIKVRGTGGGGDPTGACCLSFTNCQVVTQSACEGAGGQFRGDGSVCQGSVANPITCCPANFNQTGGVTVQDIYDFLTDWNSQVTGGPIVLFSADFNNSGSITVQDIYDFLAAWSAGCNG